MSAGQRRNSRHRRREPLRPALLVDEVVGEVVLVGGEVEESVAAEGGEDDGRLAALLGLPALAPTGRQRMRRLGAGTDPRGAGELPACREALALTDRLGLDQAGLV